MKPDLAIRLPKTGHYIVAVSGGVDSVSLLHMLATQPDSSLRLRVAHVNHGLRPDSDSDERFVRQLAQTYGLAFHSTRLELGEASEASARDLRYQFLFELLRSYQVQAIMTAHHGDDQIETSFMNTLRGSGRHGQAASLVRSRVIRPLLNLKKADLYDYAKHYSLAWREDSTNQDRSIERNFVRHELLGDIPDYSERHGRLLDSHARLNRRLDARLGKLFYRFKTDQGIEIPRPWLAEASWLVCQSLVHYSLRQLAPELEFSRAQVEEIVRSAKTAPAGSQISLPDRLKLRVGYGKVAINVDAGPALIQPVLTLEPQTSVTFGIFRLSFGSYQDSGADSINLAPGRYFVRSQRPGDRIKTASGTKKIQDIFVDAKIPRDFRQNWPIVTDQSGYLLWLPQLTHDPSRIAPSAGYQLIAEEI